MAITTAAETNPQQPRPRVGIRRHPWYERWERDELRMRATYVATRRALSPFLVPHRFEGDTAPRDLPRAKLGYGVGLNRQYVNEVTGHILNTTVKYENAEEVLGKALWDTLQADATGDGTPWASWADFVLEWMCTSLGGLVVVDLPDVDDVSNEPRPYVTFVQWSAVLDCARGRHGFKWVRMQEQVDERGPEDDATGATIPGGMALDTYTVLYELAEDGHTLFTRFDRDQKVVGEKQRDLGRYEDRFGRATLPLVEAKFGSHPDVPWCGSGLLLGLDDIVVDLYNLLSEVREAFRDAAFSLLTYTGEDHDVVAEYLKQGTRFLPLGTNKEAKLERLSVDSGEVTAGLALVDLALRQWALSARRKAKESLAEDAGRAGPSSGIALQAEFHLDLRPLLTKLCRALDQVETNTLFLLAQAADKTPKQAAMIEVERATEFRLEEEASRIARIVSEWVRSLPMPGVLVEKLTELWAEATGVLDLDELVDVVEPTNPEAELDGAGESADGEDDDDEQEGADSAGADDGPAGGATGTKPRQMALRDVLKAQAAALGEAHQQAALNDAAAGLVSPTPLRADIPPPTS